MGLTPAKRRAARVADMLRSEKHGVIQADHSRTVHTLASGYKIVELQTVSDVRRECYLMRNCVACYIGDIIDPRIQDRTGYCPSERPGDDLLGAATRVGIEGMRLMSLRAPDNLPHLTFWASDCVRDIGAYRNNPKIPEKYLKELDEWIEASGMKSRSATETAAREHIAGGMDLANTEWQGIIKRMEAEDQARGPLEEWTADETMRFEIAYCHQDSDDPYWIAECESVSRWLDAKMQRRVGAADNPVLEAAPGIEHLMDMHRRHEETMRGWQETPALERMSQAAPALTEQEAADRERRIIERIELQRTRYRELMII